MLLAAWKHAEKKQTQKQKRLLEVFVILVKILTVHNIIYSLPNNHFKGIIVTFLLSLTVGGSTAQWPNFFVGLWGHFVNFHVKIEVIKHLLS